MFCPICGKQLTDEGVCTACCANAEAPVAETEVPVVEAEVPVVDPGKGMGLAAMILGIVSISLSVICSCLYFPFDFVPFITAIVGLVLAIVAKKKTKAAGIEKNSKATVGLLLSIAAMVIILLFILTVVILYVAYGAILIGSSAY